MKTVMLTIKPKYLALMREGKKKMELRKTRPKVSPPFRVLCCESGSGGAVVAEFTVERVAQIGMPTEAAAKLAGVTRKRLETYMNGCPVYGWRLSEGTFRDYIAEDRVGHINDYGLDRPPQSWCYIGGGAEHE